MHFSFAMFFSLCGAYVYFSILVLSYHKLHEHIDTSTVYTYLCQHSVCSGTLHSMMTHGHVVATMGGKGSKNGLLEERKKNWVRFGVIHCAFNDYEREKIIIIKFCLFG